MSEVDNETGKARIQRHLQEVFEAALAAKAFAPALKALELMGREYGMWRPEQTAVVNPLSLIPDDPLAPEPEDAPREGATSTSGGGEEER